MLGQDLRPDYQPRVNLVTRLVSNSPALAAEIAIAHAAKPIASASYQEGAGEPQEQSRDAEH